MVIFSAPWIVPVESPVIRDGSVVVSGGRIVDVGRRPDIGQKYSHAPAKFYPCVLMPGLVNAHMHLELSHLGKDISSLEAHSFTDWIDALIALRASQKVSREEIAAACASALEDQHAAGVALIVDIGNEYYADLYAEKNKCRPRIVRMLEFLGPNRESCRVALGNLQKLDEQIPATAHAPYSTAPDLLLALKRRCSRLHHIFSIHTGECRDEREFIANGTGQFREFLARKNSWDGVFSFSGSRYSGTIEYFDHLGILDDRTLLVHCVDVTEKELRLIRTRGSSICLCPGSNAFLRVGQAPVGTMVAQGLLPALGTDSPASNGAIDMWREMQLLLNDYGVAATDVLAMATMGGAKALGCNADYGSLGVGKKAHFIHVSSARLASCCTREPLINMLISDGKPEKIEWVSTFYE